MQRQHIVCVRMHASRSRQVKLCEDCGGCHACSTEDGTSQLIRVHSTLKLAAGFQGRWRINSMAYCSLGLPGGQMLDKVVLEQSIDEPL